MDLLSGTILARGSNETAMKKAFFAATSRCETLSENLVSLRSAATPFAGDLIPAAVGWFQWRTGSGPFVLFPLFCSHCVRLMPPTTLSHATSGSYRCVDVTGEGEQVTRLKRMGICSGRRITVLQTGDPMILRVVGTRIGLSRDLAGSVVVEGDGVATVVSAKSAGDHCE